MTLNDLECSIHLKVRFTDGTLVVRTYVVALEFDHTHRCSRGGGGGVGWTGGPIPIPPCGQLMRCFSAVAELLVLFGSIYQHFTSSQTATYFTVNKKITLSQK